MDFFKKVVNMKFEKNGFQKNILHNTFVLYFIFFLSFGNFFMEMMRGDMYFVSLYIIIGFLTSFFNKNMIVILSISVIFANILKYGRASTFENFEGDEKKDENKEGVHQDNHSDDKDKTHHEEDENVEHKKEKKEKKKEEKKREEFGDNEDNEDDDDNEDDEDDKKKKKKKKSKDGFTEKELEDMDYEKSEKLLENQNLLLKNMKEYKPFLDTIQSIAKNMSGFTKEKNVE